MIDLLKLHIRLVALIVVVLVLAVVAWKLYGQWQPLKDDVATLERERDIAAQNLASAQSEYNLADLQDEYDALLKMPVFPTEMPAVDLSSYLASGVPLCGITITNVNPLVAGVEEIGGKRYPACMTSLAIKGGLPQIISYLDYVERGRNRFSSLKVKDVSFSGSGAEWTGTFKIVFVSQ